MITATCATIAAVLSVTTGGETIQLTGKCGVISISRHYNSRLVIDAAGATTTGVRIVGGGNVTWRGGTIRAVDARSGWAADRYGVWLLRASDVTIENAWLTAARKAIVIDQSSRVIIANNMFNKVGEDGVIASASSTINIISNHFQNTAPIQTVCTFLNGTVSGLSKFVCEQRGGSWTDGYHPDAVQLRNGMKGVLIAGNIVTGHTQGLTQMDTAGDAPIENVSIQNNRVAVNFSHTITLGQNCIACSIRWNTVTRGLDSPFRTIIRAGSAVACGNRVQDVQDGTKSC